MSYDSYPGTSRQNDIAQRKHKNITELGLPNVVPHWRAKTPLWVEALRTVAMSHKNITF